LNTWIEQKIKEFQTQLFNTNQVGEENLDDQGNDGHSESYIGQSPNSVKKKKKKKKKKKT
jgi:hypothetical protein